MANTSTKKVFLIVSGKTERLELLTEMVNRHHKDSIIYTAPSGNVGLIKTRNANIDIVIADSEEFTAAIYNMVDLILYENKNPNQAILIVGHPPKEEKFLEEIVMGKIFFLDEDLKDNEFAHVLAKALNFTTPSGPASFHLRYLAANDILIKEGEKAEFVYILKSGQLQAYQLIDGEKHILGNVVPGEFVGEMAYINNEPRSAFIEALTDVQLIEVPIELVDKILFKRPSWSKALMQTLSKRLKNANKGSGGF